MFDTTRDAFSQPMPWLGEEQRRTFFVGNSFFNLNWVSAPGSAVDRDGLGPLYNARSCSGCHFKDGRSQPPAPGSPLSAMLIRISVPGKNAHGGPLGDPVYGDQIQGSALGGATREADVFVDYTEVPGQFPDGERYSLRRPKYRMENWGYGPPSPSLLTSPRVAPAMAGVGLLEAVPESAITEGARARKLRSKSVSGRPNRVWNEETGTFTLGRFGWKAEQPSVLSQVSGAFLGDMGLTSRVMPAENHTARQHSAHAFVSGGTPEVEDSVLTAVVSYARCLAVPARRDVDVPEVRRGEDLFLQTGCADCHAPTLPLAPLTELPGLPIEDIHPYTDLLLHDLGPELSDGRPSFAAEGREWRTPPLWGMGLVPLVNGHGSLLHDGRARSPSEAILWHGGEALPARRAFEELSRADRRALIRFLESL